MRLMLFKRFWTYALLTHALMIFNIKNALKRFLKYQRFLNVNAFFNLDAFKRMRFNPSKQPLKHRTCLKMNLKISIFNHQIHYKRYFQRFWNWNQFSEAIFKFRIFKHLKRKRFWKFDFCS